MITVLIYGHLGMVPSEERASEVSMTWLLQSVSAQDWILSKAKQLGLSLSLLFACFSKCISVILFLTLKQSSHSWSAVSHEWHDISTVSWWHRFCVHINSLKVINFFINNEITHFPRRCSSETCFKESVKPTIQQKVEQNRLFCICESCIRAPSLVLFYTLSSPSFFSKKLEILICTSCPLSNAKFYICFHSHPRADQEEKEVFCSPEAEAYGMQEHLW